MSELQKNKTRELEWIFKGVANKHRIGVLILLGNESKLSVVDLSEKLKIDYKSLSEHLRKLMLAGLIMKRNDGNFVKHALTTRGKSILQFCRIVV